jgi:hypothetical protein
LRQHFNHCTLTDASYSPDNWFAKLETLKNEMKNMDHTIDDDGRAPDPGLVEEKSPFIIQQLEIKNEFHQIYTKIIS